MAGLLERIIEKAFLYTLSSYYGIVVAVNMLRMMITHGPKAFFGRRTFTRPAVLDDPSLGTHGYLHLENVRLHYVASGPDEKPLMLFLHGFPELWYSWRYQIREFNKDYRVVAIDQRGYGGSDKPKGVDSYLIPTLLNDISQAIDALGYKSCVLVAHDWGGAIAWAFARLFPDKVNKLIVMNAPPNPVFQKLLKTNTEQLKMSWYVFLFQIPYLPELFLKSFDYAFIDRMYGIASPFPSSMIGTPTHVKPNQEDLDAYKYTFSQPGAVTSSVNWYRASTRKRVTYDMNYDMPVLIIWGMKDFALHHTIPDIAQQMNPNISVTRIPEAGHFVQFDTPDSVNKAMRDWLGKQSAKL